MSAGDFKRLQAWSEKNGEYINVENKRTASGREWTIKVESHVPRVNFTAVGTGNSADDAATVAIAQLQEVGDVIA